MKPSFAQTVLSKRVLSIKGSGIREFFEYANAPNKINLSIGEPDFNSPKCVIKAAMGSLVDDRTHYTSNSGTFELRQALSTHLFRRYGVEYSPEGEILITVGASEALDIALRATINPGDEIVTHKPTYVAYDPLVSLSDGLTKFVATSAQNGFEVSPRSIGEAITCKTKGILLSNPCNPTGAVMTKPTLEDIARIANERGQLVFSDEIYDRLVYEGHAHHCMSSFPGMKERTILLGGFSKAYAMTGWRLGFMCAPREIIEAAMKIHQYAVMSTPTIAQDAALAALNEGEDDVKRMVDEYDRRRRLVVMRLNAMGLPTENPKGAFYAFPDISQFGLSSKTFAWEMLLHNNVVVVPGHVFGDAGEGYVRLCYASAYEKIEEGLERIERFINSEHCKR